jgi:hypothetical protein
MCTNKITSWLVHRWNIFGALMNHKHSQTHKTHHSLDLGEGTTFLLIIFLLIHHEGYHPNGVFPKTPKSRISQFPKLGFSPLWMPIISFENFRLRWNLKQNYSKITVEFFSTICGTLVNTCNSRWFLTFSGRGSNWHFDF